MSTAFEPETVFVSFDLETTGLSPRTDRIIEVGAVRFTESQVLDTLQTLANPGVPIPLPVQRLCGLKDHDLVGQPTPEEVVAQLAEFCQDAVLVGHGVAFDLAFCAEILPETFSQRTAIDTSELARILLPRAASHSLEQLTRGLDLGHDRPHRALSDADATRQLLARLLAEAAGFSASLRARLRFMCEGSGWLAGELLAAHLARGSAAPVGEAERGESLAVLPAPAPRSAPVPAGNGRLALGEIRAAFEAGGALATSDPRFELREEQQQMAVAVAQTFNRGERLLVEAGTGVGKSLAYLLPAREWANLRHEPVVVSTHTITLQEQLLNQDIPVLEAARPLPVAVTVLKGRGNYVSLRRLERWMRRGPAGGRRRDLEELRFQLRCVVWAEQTSTGDRAELRLAGRDPEFWEMVQSSVDDCLGPACHNWRDRRCFMARARLAAREADMVIVNHALLLADADSAGRVLPETMHLIVDEAHHLEEAATQTQGRRLTVGSVLAVIDRLPEFPDRVLTRSLQAARQAVQAAVADLRQLLESRSTGGNGRFPLVIDRRAAEIPEWAACEATLARMVRGLERAAAGLRDAARGASIEGLLWPQPDNAGRECELAADALLGAAALAGMAIGAVAGADSESVLWVEGGGRSGAVLRSAPADVAEALRERLFSRCESLVLTSATMAVAGSFTYIKERLGIRDAEELVLDSPFDYLRQSLLCLPRGIPGHADPSHPGTVARLAAGVAEALGGRTLVLFTGYAAMREVAAQIRTLLAGRGIAVLGQGLDGTRNQVLRSFRQNPRTVLLGTSSFWEGIDLPGDLLQCVVIDKLPFPVPTDPIFQARARGQRDSFNQLALPEAVLRLKQGFGRLVRSRDDFGAVVVCDPRILERRYGESFVTALPRATVSREPVEAVALVVKEFVSGSRVVPASPAPGD